MSVAVSTAVWEHSQASGNDLLVLLVLADCADAETGRAYPGVARMARHTKIAERTVQRCLARLVETGEIKVEREGGRINGRNMPTVYRILVGRKQGCHSVTPTADLGVTSDATGVTPGAFRGDIAVSPEPTTNHQELQPTTKTDAPAALALSGMVGKKKVTAAESELAVAVLAAWNERTGQSLGSREWLAKIVMRHREHPKLSVDEHSAVIASALADPWWTGAPSPAVVYGNGAVFETSLVRSVNGNQGGKPAMRYGRGMTTQQILDMGRGKS